MGKDQAGDTSNFPYQPCQLHLAEQEHTPPTNHVYLSTASAFTAALLHNCILYLAFLHYMWYNPFIFTLLVADLSRYLWILVFPSKMSICFSSFVAFESVRFKWLNLSYRWKSRSLWKQGQLPQNFTGIAFLWKTSHYFYLFIYINYVYSVFPHLKLSSKKLTIYKKNEIIITKHF